MVIRDLCCIGMLDIMVIVKVLSWHGYGVLCPISLRRNEGARIRSGAASPGSSSQMASPLMHGFDGTLTRSCSTLQLS